jgi:hypothetical protein
MQFPGLACSVRASFLISRAVVFKAILLLFVLAAGKKCGAADNAIDFNQDIRPLLSDRCFSCHGPDAAHRKADLRLDTEDDAKAYAIVPGDPEASLLVERITATDPDLIMPPPQMGKPLSESEIARLTQWIEQDAPYSPHWAYVAPRLTTVHSLDASTDTSNATSADDAWARNWIDTFVLESQSKHNLRPTVDADPPSLLRRLSFDLTGLPPSLELVERYKTDPSEQTYRAIVDQLLDSDRFGERLAILWLDLVRYADTVGYHGDQDHNIAPYRDWVIDAFNDNMPFDQFTREQLAGDLIPGSNVDQKIASGYNRLLQTTHEGGLQPKEYLAIYAADRVRNLSAVWMGATLGCAQCHDHKYDPFTAKDFYSMAAFFADIDEARHFKEGSNSLPTKRPPEIDVLRPNEREELNRLDQEIAKLQSRIEALQPDLQPGVNGEATQDAELGEQIERLRAARERLSGLARKTMITVATHPRPMRVLPRGNWLDESGPIVDPAVPESLQRPIPSDQRPTRLDLANWLTDVDDGYGGMAARVMVNRLWAMLFGTGLSVSLEDFGGQGQPPHHPQLLDNLAIEFYESNWDIKHMLRLIVHSHTYRLASVATPQTYAQDPENKWLARQNRFRLPAEMIRDQALLLGNLLVLESGGQSSRPYQPAGYYRHLNFPTRTYKSDADRNQYRRGVYVHWQRQFLHPMLRAFDAPSREECTAKRATSNTPLAALVMMNDPTIVEAARGFASRLLADTSAKCDHDRIQLAFQWALGRTPSDNEHQVLADSLAMAKQEFSESPDQADQWLAVGLWKPTTPLDPIQLASWTEVARTILNLSESVVRP